MERHIFIRFIHVCLASIAITSVTLMFVLVPVSTPPTAWAIQEPPPPPLPVSPTPGTTTSEGPTLTSGDFNQLIDLTAFHFTMNVESCNDSNLPTLLVIVHSAPENLHKRLAIRETWGSSSKYYNLRVLFTLGININNNYTMQSILLKEQNKYNDMIQGNFIDKYRNITYKHVMAFKWINYNCPNTKYILKSDDDVFINMPNLIKFLPTLPTSRLIFCDVIKHANVKRSWRSKWRVAYHEFSGRTYPDYCAGWVIIYSGDVVRRLYAEAQTDSYFWVDDVHLTGVMAQKANIRHMPAERWKIEENIAKSIILKNKWPNNLSNKLLIGPYDMTPHIIRSLWKLLVESSK